MALRWLGLVGAIWLQSINATNSNFPAYSSQLKSLMSISQLQLNNIAVASDAGKLIGWFSGIAAAHLPLWVVLMIGSLLGLIGYGLQFLFMTNHIAISYTHVVLLSVLAGTSICWINTVCYIVAIRNFELDCQIAVGLSTSYFALSAKIYTDFVDALFPPESPIQRAKAYLLLNSVLPLIVCVFTSPVVSEIKTEKSRKMEGGLFYLFFITISTGIFAVISSLGSIQKLFSPLIILIGLLVLLLSPLLIPFLEQTMERLQKKCWVRVERRVHVISPEEISGVERMENGVTEENCGIEIDDGKSSVMNEIGVKLMLKKVEFWLYYIVYLCGATLGLVYMNNLGQIAESRGCSNTSSLVSLSSSFGFFGRLLPSLLEYYYLSKSKYTVSRPASIASMMAPMSGAFFLLLNQNNLSLYISTAIIGISTSAITSISISTTTELFGAKNFSINHNILITNIPIGSFLFGDFAAILYRKEAHRGHNMNGRCMGMECYRTTFIIWGCLCFVGTLLALVLHRQTKKFYSQRL